MKLTISIVCLVTLIAIGVGWYFVNQDKQTAKTVTPLPQATTTYIPTQPQISPLHIPQNWKTFTSGEYGFSIRHPEDITHETTLEGERFYKLGETQSTGTELYDGINVVIKAGSLEGKPFDEWVNQKYQNTKNDPVQPRVGDKTQTIIAGITGLSFTVSSLGDSVMIYLPKGENQYLEITNGTIEPSDREQTFQKTVNMMLSSIRIL